MCKQSSKPHLTKKDFTIPEGWQDNSPLGTRIRETREGIIAALGPKLVQELSEPFAIIFLKIKLKFDE